MAILYGILMTIITGAALAALVLVVRHLPKSDCQQVEILSTQMLAAWERGFFMHKNNADPNYIAPELRLADREEPEPEYVPGPYDENPDIRKIADDSEVG